MSQLAPASGLSHYDILGLPTPGTGGTAPPSAQDLKLAYRRALLRFHPDKILPDSGTTRPDNRDVDPATAPSVDQITLAYQTLSHSASRAEYDRVLALQPPGRRWGQRGGDGETFRSGLDTVDLDDLDFHEAEGVWYCACRCGDERGFLVREAELEKEAAVGELVVGCRGCSLWLKILFQAVNEETVAADGMKG